MIDELVKEVFEAAEKEGLPFSSKISPKLMAVICANVVYQMSLFKKR